MEQKICVMFYDSPFCRIGIGEKDGKITNVFFGGTVAPLHYGKMETPILREAVSQLEEYFSGSRNEFTLPVMPEGTDFEKKVWEALQTIPYGETRTYRQIAEQIGNAAASRAVGRANGQNPISILIPCHRVIGTNGKLTGYAGGVEMKEALLKLERGQQTEGK